MASLTQYFGLQRLDGGESFAANAWKFTDEDKVIVDRLLYLALSGHSHTGAAAGGEGTPDSPELTLLTSGGSLPPATRIYYRITLVDALGNESVGSIEVFIDTPDAITEPNAPVPRYETSGGTLLAGGYFYVLSAYTDVNTQETRALHSGQTIIPTGATNQVILTLPDLPSGASGFNVYRRKPGASQNHYLASIDMTVATPPDEYVDDGSVSEDCNRGLPVTNTTNSANRVTVDFPGASPVIPADYTWKVYRTMVAGQYASSLLQWVVETTVENGDIVVTSIDDIGQATLTGRPPDVTQLAGSPAKVLLTDGAEVQGSLPLGMTAFPHIVTFSYPGTLSTTIGDSVWVCEAPAATIIGCRASLGRGSVPAATPVLVDVNKGSGATPVYITIYTSQGNRPAVPVGLQRGTRKAPAIVSLVEGDSLTVDIDQAGGAASPTDENLTVHVYMILHGYPDDESFVPGTTTGT